MSPIEPVIISFLIADTVIQEKGTNKWSAIGIFDRIYAANFPTIHQSIALYIRLSDAEGDYRIRVEFCDDKDHVITFYEGITLSVPSRLLHPDLGIKTVNLPILKPGKYYFKLYFNEKFAKGFPLDVLEIPKSGKENNS